MSAADAVALRAVGDVFLVEPEALAGRSRHRHVMRGRVAAAWVLRHALGRTLESVTETLGRSDYASTRGFLKEAEALRIRDDRFRRRSDAVVARVAASLEAEQVPA